jgi:glycosyltransferase involved in cell wall biosynthesis
MIGDGPLLKQVRKSAGKNGISDRVLFTGIRPHREIPLWLNAADCLMLSSRSEGMPNAIAEALACGCPVAATDVGACREMLAGQPCTRIVPSNNKNAMSAALAEVLQEAEHTDKRPDFERTWTDMAQDILQLTRG